MKAAVQPRFTNVVEPGHPAIGEGRLGSSSMPVEQSHKEEVVLQRRLHTGCGREDGAVPLVELIHARLDDIRWGSEVEEEFDHGGTGAEMWQLIVAENVPVVRRDGPEK